VGSVDYNVYALTSLEGSLAWKYATGNSVYSSPAVGSDGTMYVGSTECSLCSVGLYTPSSAFSYCLPCLPGTYSDVPGSSLLVTHVLFI